MSQRSTRGVNSPARSTSPAARDDRHRAQAVGFEQAQVDQALEQRRSGILDQLAEQPLLGLGPRFGRDRAGLLVEPRLDPRVWRAASESVAFLASIAS